MKQVILVRGLPGAGGPEFARSYAAGKENTKVLIYGEEIAGNMFYETYRSTLRSWYLENLVVSYWFSVQQSCEPFVRAAHRAKWHVTVVDLFDAGLGSVRLAERSDRDAFFIEELRQSWQHNLDLRTEDQIQLDEEDLNGEVELSVGTWVEIPDTQSTGVIQTVTHTSYMVKWTGCDGSLQRGWYPKHSIFPVGGEA